MVGDNLKAVIDIGSNSVRLMLWADGKAFLKQVSTTRLGRGEKHLLSKEAIAETLDAVKRFYLLAKENGAEVFAFATAAVRSAYNKEELLYKIERETSLKVDVVSGEEEALLGLYGVFEGRDGAIVDIGGASTEICVKRGETFFSKSLELGAVRLYEECKDDREKLFSYLSSYLSSIELPTIESSLYAIGGTASTLASIKLGLSLYDASKLQGLKLTRGEIDSFVELFFSLPLAERKKIRGMDERRADILGGGAIELSLLLKKLKKEEVFFSDRDNLEGYLFKRRELI